ncbi:MAG: FliM/FliN family flagellar motor switch protein, partial [Rhizobiaceae bacterium]
EATETLTLSETGLLRIFSQQVVETLRSTTNFKADLLTIANTGFVDLDDLRQVTGVVVPISVSTGNLKSGFDLILRETVLDESGAEEDRDTLAGPANEDVMNTVIVATASLKLQPITLGAAGKIQVGDILQLANRESLAACFIVKDKPVFDGALGRSGDRYSLQIEHSLRPNRADAAPFV